MSFASLEYFLFLPAAFLVFYFTRRRFRWLALLLSSYLFYAALLRPHLLAALAAVTLVTYWTGLRLAAAGDQRSRRGFFWLGTAAGVATLASFKYLSFFAGALAPVLARFLPIPPAAAALPVIESVGVSYYVFQAISYLADIYLEKDKPERHLGYFALYLAFFPKLLQGPIERASKLIPQLRAEYRFDYALVVNGLFLFAVGLFKKAVIADRLASLPNLVYGDVHSFSGVSLISATLAYSLQIYYDFSGYTDMALGAAALFNIRLTQNFRSPYLAASVADFWRRWHISFSTWLLDYLFRPLQMHFRRLGIWGNVLALMATFAVCGLWHGASWTFLLWGLLHGVYLSVSVLTRKLRAAAARLPAVSGLSRLKRPAQTALTFLLVSFAWIFFRAGSAGDAFYVVGHLFSGVGGFLLHLGRLRAGQGALQPVLLTLTRYDLLIIAVAIAFIETIHRAGREAGEGTLRFPRPVWLKWSIYYGLTAAVLSLANFAAPSGFIYFRF